MDIGTDNRETNTQRDRTTRHARPGPLTSPRVTRQPSIPRAPDAPSSSVPSGIPLMGRRGRGARSNQSSRFETLSYAQFDDGWSTIEEAVPLKTHVTDEAARKIITRNTSPDIPFDRSINPYRGCEHGCVYCFARPTHAFMGLSPGLDFESKLFAKPNAAALLAKELSKPGYKVQPIAIGTNTDAYQPIERKYRIMRQILEVLDAYNHPVTIVTKSALITRDLDILSSMAGRNLVRVALSITTLDTKLARAMEPRASAPTKRMATLEILSAAGIPTGVMVAPVIPGLNDHEIERILRGSHYAGATQAGFILLRLPREIKDLFYEWLQDAVPDKAAKVMKLVRDTRGGKDYDAEWGKRMRGDGPYAWTIKRRFEIAARKLGLNVGESSHIHALRGGLDCQAFAVPPKAGDQLALL
ncbi:MAG: radical SAM protein [Rhodobiaceae bacterium]|nr:MAG: radical SAM protein [Rhodobiaceae bacterium]